MTLRPLDLFAPAPRFANLEALFAAIEAFGDDPLKVHGTRIVICRGNPGARLMLIGEAPGADEDRLGQPFVGRSGQLLDQILRSVGFDPAVEAFVTNAVYRRPPENRKPTTEEIDWYRPYVLEMVRLVDPLIILLIGGVAALSLLGEKRGITQIRGQWFDWHGRRVMPLFHPAYLLRNQARTPGSPKALTWQDIQEVRRVYDRLVAEAAAADRA